ncbi:hypothetical protein D3C72_816600 [compost metagenome]
MLFIQLIAADQAVGGSVPGITVVIVAEQAVDQAFPQGATRQRHALYVQGLEDGDQDGEAGGEHGQPLGGQPFQLQPIQPATGDGLTHQLLQLRQGDPLALPLRQHDLLQRLDGAGGADTGAPAESAVIFRHLLQYRLGGGNGLLETGLGELAVTEVIVEPGDAAHVQAVEQFCFAVLADHQFGTGAADVDHQPVAFPCRGPGDPFIDGLGLFLARDDLDAVVEHPFRFAQELVDVGGEAQGGGTHHPDVVGRNVLQLLGEQAQAVPAPLHGGTAETKFRIETGGEANLALDLGDGAQGTGDLAHHQHVKAVGAEVDGGIERRVVQLGPSLSSCVADGGGCCCCHHPGDPACCGSPAGGCGTPVSGRLRHPAGIRDRTC